MSPILVVDDEPMILRLLCEILTRAGYPVISATDAEQAIQICRKQDPQIDLAIVDYLMPGQNGPALVSTLRELQPELRILLMSGFTGIDGEPETAGQFAGFLHKPFNIETAIESVRSALEQRSAASVA